MTGTPVTYIEAYLCGNRDTRSGSFTSVRDLSNPRSGAYSMNHVPWAELVASQRMALGIAGGS